MTLNRILESGLKITIVAGSLSVRGHAELVSEFGPHIKDWKPELIQMLAGKTVDSVGHCDTCHCLLIGMPTFDKYINRVCPDCGAWNRCLKPSSVAHQDPKHQTPKKESQADLIMSS